MEEKIPGANKSNGKASAIILIGSIFGFALYAFLIFALISNNMVSLDPFEGGAYQWAADLEYTEEINLNLVSAEMDERGIDDYNVDFNEDTWESDRLFGESIPGISRTWNMFFYYNITLDIEKYKISNDTLEQLDFIVDSNNGTVELPIYCLIYNNHYDDGFSTSLNMYNAYITSPWSDYGVIFDGIPWKQIIEDEMPNFKQLIEDATGLEPKSSKVVKQYS
ncbi:MAG: hypothetical protein KKH41_09790 [Candidatus Thermoplasmatota archaeon]|nr:hypothetical protein [Euryarchaeota archaeon]MBU4031949.1 hypothetical protein [Candidatus Thermoplasmatota archaeon]MBU4144886.1 hypothetical protein [Candidatus Thermoplasmatota archaeon]MBU4592853.1 hypothetical protein [Candidatus Thermoplasmatota archaeon]